MRSKILYEDDYLLVVHKPAGLATQTSKVGEPDVVSELKKYLRQDKEPYLGVVHRLDQPVEGVLVFAKNPETAKKLSAQLGEGILNKQYRATVCGKPPMEKGKLVDYLYKDENQKAQVTTKEQAKAQQAKEAVLSYEMVEKVSAEDESDVYLMDISIETGRFHQIRAQMAHAGMPLLGDRKYGTEQSMEVSTKRKIRNVALIAYQISFVHPKTGKRMEYSIL